MKNILLTICSLGLAFVSNAQTIHLLIDGFDLTGSSYTYTIPVTNTNENKLHIDIANTTSSDMAIYVRKNVISATSGQQNSFCIGSCYPPSTMESTESYPLTSNDTTHAFYAEFSHGNAVGQTVVEYTVFDRGNSENTSKITVTFNVTSGGTAVLQPTHSISLTGFPNPATSGYISFKVEGLNSLENNRIVIRNILGVTVKSIDANSNLIRANIDDLPNGIYLYTLEQNGKNLATKRFLVRK